MSASCDFSLKSGLSATGPKYGTQGDLSDCPLSTQIVTLSPSENCVRSGRAANDPIAVVRK